MTRRRCAVSGAIAVRLLRRVPTKTATDAKLGTAHVIDPSLEIPGWGFSFLRAGLTVAESAHAPTDQYQRR